jgi:hypothetical protein
MSDRRIGNIQKSYDKIADEYVALIYHELRHKPLDRQIVGPIRFEGARSWDGLRYRLRAGALSRATYESKEREVCGVDISFGMIERARRLNPGIEFQQNPASKT